MANQFDRWQKDAFFSTAEEVQESADIMESAYRIWERERREGMGSDDSVELRRELHTALGTTKWQLEEFERAVKLYHQDHFADDMVDRHKQFVRAIKNKVSHIEKALRESLAVEGKQRFRWVQIDKQDRDDLSVFLSGRPEGLREIKDLSVSPTDETSKENQYSICIPTDRVCSLKESNMNSIGNIEIPLCKMGCKEVLSLTEDHNCIIELAEKDIMKTMDEIQFSRKKLDMPERTLSSTDIGAWKVVFADEDSDRKALEPHPLAISHFLRLLRSIECRTKLSLCRNSSRKLKVGCHQDNMGISGYLDRGVSQLLSQGTSALSKGSRCCLPSCREYVKTSYTREFHGHAEGLRKQLKSIQYYVQSSVSLRLSLMILLIIIFVAIIVLCAI